MTTVYLSSDSRFQQDNTPYSKAQILSDWPLECDKWPPQSQDLIPAEHVLDVVEWVILIMDMQL